MTPKRTRFVAEYLVDLNGAAAAVRAGYSKRTARQIAHELLAMPAIVAEIVAAERDRAARTELSQDWIVERLKENVARAMTATEVYDRDGNATGEFTYQGNVANRALELLGKHLGMFTDHLHVSGKLEVWTVDAIDARIAELSARHSERAELDEAITA